MRRGLPPGRVRLLAALAGVVLLGLESRLHPLGWHLHDKSLGDVLYAAAVYLVVALAGLRPLSASLLALGICLAIETFQLTGIGARCDHLLVVRWVLGTTFSWHDVVCYGVGIGMMLALDRGVLRPARARS